MQQQMDPQQNGGQTTANDRPHDQIDIYNLAIASTIDSDLIDDVLLGLGNYSSREYWQQVDSFRKGVFSTAAFTRRIRERAIEETKVELALNGVSEQWEVDQTARAFEADGWNDLDDETQANIDETWPEPKYVKPKAKGGGIAEFEHEGHTYLFPRKARLPSEREGMWTVVHRKGEADPINPQESHSPAIKSDTLQEYLTMRVSSSAPGLFDRLDLDPKTVMMVLIGSIILFAILSDVFGGGV